MRILLLAFFTLGTLCTELDAQEVRWQQLIDAPGANVAVDLLQLPDGDFLVIGARSDSAAVDTTVGGITVTRITAAGTVRWTRQPTLQESVNPVAVFDAGDGRFRIIGWTSWRPLPDSGRFIWSGLFDSSGTLLSRVMSGQQHTSISYARRHNRDGFLATGTYKTAYGTIARLDSNGKAGRTSQLIFGDREYRRELRSMVQRADGWIVSVGYSYDEYVKRSSTWIKLHVTETTPNVEYFHDTLANEQAFDVLPLPDTTVFVVGTSRDLAGIGPERLVVARHSRKATEMWRVTPTAWSATSDSLVIQRPHRVIPWGVDEFLIVGKAGPGRTVPFAMLMDRTGAVRWTHLLGDPSMVNAAGTNVAALADGDYVLVGTSNNQMLIVRAGTEPRTGVELERDLPLELDLSSLSPTNAGPYAGVVGDRAKWSPICTRMVAQPPLANNVQVDSDVWE